MQKESPTLIAEEIASICSGEVPSTRCVKVLGLPSTANQLSQVLVVGVVVKGADILAAAHHVVHLRGVVDRVRQHPECWEV